MIIDEQTFTEITLHLRRASDDLLGAARRLALYCDPDRNLDDRGELLEALESLVAMNRQFSSIEEMLRVIWETNRSAARHSC